MKQAGSVFIGLGILSILLGVLIRSGWSAKWLGKLPGDITIHKGNFSLYVPLATSLLLSLLLSLVLFLVFKLLGRN